MPTPVLIVAGSDALVTAAFQSPPGTLANPTSVWLVVAVGSLTASPTYYEYGSSAMTNPSTGIFQMVLDTYGWGGAPGSTNLVNIYCEWFCTGGFQVVSGPDNIANPGFFQVIAPQLPTEDIS